MFRSWQFSHHVRIYFRQHTVNTALGIGYYYKFQTRTFVRHAYKNPLWGSFQSNYKNSKLKH